MPRHPNNLGCRSECKVRSCGWIARGSTVLSVATALARHRREKHTDSEAAERRRAQQRLRQCAVRLEVPLPAPVVRKRPALQRRPAADTLVSLAVVTAPLRRDTMWERARAELLRVGFEAEHVRRRKGIDFAAYTDPSSSFQRELAPGLKASTFLHYDFLEFFLPYCSQVFEQMPDVGVIWWVEDDIKFKAGVTAAAISAEASQHTACLLWFGYMRVKGKPRYGSHLVGVARGGIRQLMAHLSDQRKVARDGGKPLGHLIGLDTLLHRMLRVEAQPWPLAVCSVEPWAHQIDHLTRWRH